MGEVIEVDFTDDNTGYIFDDSNNVTGIYCGDTAAGLDQGIVYMGTEQKREDNLAEVECSVTMTLEEMNQFCLMWLLIFDPDVFKQVK